MNGLAPGLAVHLRMEHRVSAAQLLLSELLVLPVADLDQRVAAELDANTALELPAVPVCSGCGHPAWRGVCPSCARRSESGECRDRLGRIAGKSSPRDVLLAEAARAVRTADRPLAARLLAEVDDLGLLPEPIAVVAARFGVGPGDVRRVIQAFRVSGAPGLGAENLVVRLRLQVAADEGAVPPEVDALVANGLGALAGGGPDDAAAVSGLRSDQVGPALAWIRSHIEADLFRHDDSVAPVPVDVVVGRHGDQLVADIVPGPWSALRVAESYLAAAADPLVHRDVVRARRFIDALDRRSRTLFRVVQVVITRQARRMAEGRRAHRQLLRRDVAAELDLHESTVSRVVAGKHLLLPTGETVEFGTLFGAMHGMRECLRDLVAAESVPRSDAELVCALAGQGFHLSRRTVAKHRAALGIPKQSVR